MTAPRRTMDDVYRAFWPKVTAYDDAHHVLANLQNRLRICDDHDEHASLTGKILEAEAAVNSAWKERDWTKAAVRPFADMVAEYLGGTAEVGGPYGIGARCSVKISAPASDGMNSGNDDMLYFEVESMGDLSNRDDWRLGIIDLTRETRSYPPNSIGRLNGLQFSGRPLEPHFDMKAVVDVAVVCGWTVEAPIPLRDPDQETSPLPRP